MVKTFLAINLLVAVIACDGPPKITLNQLDTIHGIANPFKITKYDKQKCIIELSEEASFPIMSDRLHGAFCLTKEDAADYKAWAQAKCKNDQHIEKIEEENRELKKQIGLLILRKCFEDK